MDTNRTTEFQPIWPVLEPRFDYGYEKNVPSQCTPERAKKIEEKIRALIERLRASLSSDSETPNLG